LYHQVLTPLPSIELNIHTLATDEGGREAIC
jgi:hypothetical protein